MKRRHEPAAFFLSSWDDVTQMAENQLFTNF